MINLSIENNSKNIGNIQEHFCGNGKTRLYSEKKDTSQELCDLEQITELFETQSLKNEDNSAQCTLQKRLVRRE